MDLLRTHEIYVNVCMNSFIIDVEAPWSAVGLNKNEYPEHKSNVECLLYLHFRDSWCLIHVVLKVLFGGSRVQELLSAAGIPFYLALEGNTSVLMIWLTFFPKTCLSLRFL